MKKKKNDRTPKLSYTASGFLDYIYGVKLTADQIPAVKIIQDFANKDKNANLEFKGWQDEALKTYKKDLSDFTLTKDITLYAEIGEKPAMLAKAAEWVAFGNAWLDVSNSESAFNQLLQGQNGGNADNSVLGALHSLENELNRIVFKYDGNDLSLSLTNGTVYGSKTQPIEPEYSTYLTLDNSDYVLNFLWGTQTAKQMAGYTFINKVPQSLKIPVPFYYSDGESNPGGWCYTGNVNGTYSGYSNSTVEVNPQEQFSTNEMLKDGILFSSKRFSKTPNVYYEIKGSSGGYIAYEDPSSNQWAATFKLPMSVQYTVDIAPITEGGTPILTGGTPTTDPQAAVKGMNSEHFRSGEINTGADSDYQVGLALDGKETTGAIIGTYGTDYEAMFNPDQGYEVDYYIVKTFDPITGVANETRKISAGEGKTRAAEEGFSASVGGKVEIRVAYKQPPTIKKSGPDQEYVKQGDSIVYTLDLGNTALAPYDVTVTDVLPDEVQAESYQVVDGDGNEIPEGTGTGWPGKLDLSIPAAVKSGDVLTPGKLTITIRTTVTQEFSKTESKDNIISNQASMVYDENQPPKKTNIITNYIDPKLGYTMEKTRTTAAPAFDGAAGKFGFEASDKAAYEIEIENTGEMPLTMDVSDAFEDAGYFENLKIAEVTIDGESKGGLEAAKTEITIPEGKTAVVTCEAVVGADVPAKMSDAAQDDGKGYENTAAATAVTATYNKVSEAVYEEIDGEKTLTIRSCKVEETIVNKDTPGYTEDLADQSDTAHTPVQPNIGYKLSKIREDAPEFKNTGLYGFKNDDTVTYKISVENTGTESLTMDVEDAFTNPAYFTNLTYADVTDAIWNNEDNKDKPGHKPNITVGAGATAEITVTAEVAAMTPNLLAAKANNTAEETEAAKGYVNTASTSNVVCNLEGVDVKLPGQTAKAKTPVQPKTSYEITKTRTTPAPLFKESDYGFIPGSDVSYEIEVKNTGTTKLYMTVTDTFTEPGNFMDLTYSVADGDGSGIVWTNKANTSAAPQLEIEAQKTAVITVTARISASAQASLSGNASDDGKGYENVAAAAGVYSEYPKPDGGTGREEPGEKSDTAHTPVQPNPGFSITKRRTLDAQEFAEHNFGFVKDDTVTYAIDIINTGSLPLTMTVTDTFDITENFREITYTGVDNAVWINNTGAGATGTAPQIKVEAGQTATVYVSAKVNTEEYALAGQANGDTDGYRNTAKADSVTYPYTGHDGRAKTGELDSQEAYGYTPVKPVPGYEISKTRVTTAGKFTEGNYGFKAGDTVTYKITVQNTGNLDLTMKVSDTFEEAAYFEEVTYTEVENADWYNSSDKTQAPEITVVKKQTAVITVTAKVADGTPYALASTDSANEGYKNTAVAAEVTYTFNNSENAEVTGTLPSKNAEAKTPVRPEAGYTLTKTRKTEATKFAEGAYGFAAGDVVTYEIGVENTGDLPVTATITDTFADAAYFEELTYTEVEHADWLNRDEGGAPQITVAAGETAIVTVTAKVADTAPYLFAGAAADDGNGYENTAASTEVTGTYRNAQDIDAEVTLTDQEAKAHTPVQPAIGYELEKVRVTPAGEFLDTGFYGFKNGEQVTYRIRVKNTGMEKLTMNVEDSFNDAGCFTELTYTDIQDADWNNQTQTGAKPNITVEAGKTAVITVTAKVSDQTSASLAQGPNDNAEDAKGYVNTAKTSEVTCQLDGVTEPLELLPQEATAKTPVQPRAEYTIKKTRTTEAPEFENGTYGFLPGTSVSYEITVENKGTVSLNMKVADTFTEPENFTDLTYSVAESEGVQWKNNNKPAETPQLELVAGKTAVITVSAKISASAAPQLSGSASDEDNKGYENVAKAAPVTYIYPRPDGEVGTEELEEKTDEAHTPVQPKPGFEISKRRTLDAGAFVDGSFGFIKDEQVTYEIGVINTGTVPLTMTITDRFENADYFTDITYTRVTGAKWLNAPTEGSTQTAPKITVAVGQTAVVFVSAKVNTEEYALSGQAKDDGKGYKNIASAGEVTYPYTDENGDEQEGNADPKEATANTPVRPVPEYQIAKSRVTKAGKFAEGNYGFKAGETVTYEITVQNTGNLDLTMKVSDTFTDAAYFHEVTYTDVQNAVWHNKTDKTRAPEITITKKQTAVITVTAKVADGTPYALASTESANEGYKNTAAAADVTYKFKNSAGTEVTGTLPGKTAEAKTPVRPETGYKLTKERKTEAKKFAEGAYGFAAGDEVTYEIAVENTGTLPITATVTDAFTDASYFEAFTYKEVKNAEWINKNEGGAPEITVAAGQKATVIVTAKVAAGAEYLLSGKAADDGKGHENIASSTNVTYTYQDAQGENVTGSLDPQEAKAYTPVIPKVGYTLEKERVSEAKVNHNKNYGFYQEDQVEYKVTVKNTGDLPLDMKISDVYDLGADNFEALTYTKVEGADWTNNESETPTTKEPTIHIEAGKTAVITITARIKKLAMARVSNAAKDDGRGYQNTASASEVTYSYQKPGTTDIMTGKLDGQSDTAHTPILPSLWGSNTTDDNKGGNIEANNPDGSTVDGSQSDSETGDHDEGRLSANIISGTPRTFWGINYDQVSLSVPYLTPEEEATVQKTSTVKNGSGMLTFSYTDRYGEKVEITGVVSIDPKTGKLSVNITETKMTSKDGEVFIVAGMARSTDVNIPFVPTIWVENTTAGQEGGSVQVVGKTDWSNGDSGDHEVGRPNTNAVQAKPEVGWDVDYENLSISLPALKGGTSRANLDANGNGTITFTSADGKTVVTAVVTTNADRSVVVSINDMKDPVDVHVPFKQRKPEITLTKEADKKVVDAGGKVTYTIEVENTGDYDLVDVVVDDKNITPKSVTGVFTSIILADGSKKTIKNGSNSYEVGNLAIGESVTLTFAADVPSTIDTSKQIHNIAGVESSYIPVGGTEKEPLDRIEDNADVTLRKVVKHTKDLQVKKVWSDNNNSAGKRPTSVTMTLYKDGYATSEKLELNAGNNWSGSFKKLEIETGSTTHKYTVVETSVSNYTASYSNTDGLITVTNTYKAPYKAPETKKTTNVKTGDRTPILGFALLMALAGITCVGISTRRKKEQ